MVIEDSVAAASKAAACTTTTDVRSVRVNVGVGSQQLARGTGALREEKDELAVVATGLGGQRSKAVTDTVTVAVLTQAGDNRTAKVKEMIIKLMAENLALHGKFVAEKTAHAHAVFDSVRLEWT